jgi:predicted ribosomally synthesized peptide with SipW-like signal peptide
MDENRDAHKSPSRRQKIYAVLASGVVLGIGTAVTLAVWNDSEYATGEFTAGVFILEGASTAVVNDPVFSDHSTVGTAAPLQFVVDASALSPGTSVSAPFAVRLGVGTTNAADVALVAQGTTGAMTGLTYEIQTSATWGCGTPSGSLVPALTALGSVPASTEFTLTQGATGVAGTPAFFCFVVTANAALESGQTGTATWNFSATSVAP